MIEVLLDVLFTVILLILLGIASLQFWNWYYRVPLRPDATHYVTTDDGWRLALHHYRPATGPVGDPVVLCHGLASNRYTFDLPGAPSLARYLRDHGRDVWVAELRGSGMSDKPSLLAADVPFTWGFEDHLGSDVPAIVRGVLERSGATSVHWVGHSMGGSLLLAYLAPRPDAPLASGVAMGSPVDFSKCGDAYLRRLLILKPLMKPFSVFPLLFITRLLAPLAYQMAKNLPGIFQPSNVEPIVTRKFFSLALQLMSATKLWLDFARFLETARFCRPDGRPYLDGLSSSAVPILLAVGAKDYFAPPPAAIAAFGAPNPVGERSSVTFGKEHGCQEDYGHADLVLGMRSQGEVFPVLLAWLEEHDLGKKAGAG